MNHWWKLTSLYSDETIHRNTENLVLLSNNETMKLQSYLPFIQDDDLT